MAAVDSTSGGAYWASVSMGANGVIVMDVARGSSTTERVVFRPTPTESVDPPDMNGLSDVLTRLGKVEEHLGNVRADVSSVKTQLSHMPTKAWILTNTVGVLVALVLSMAGGYLYIGKAVLPLLAKIAGAK